MADLAITAANVLPGAGASVRMYTAGSSIGAGAALYRKRADGKVYLALAAGAATPPESSTCCGIAAESASAGQPVGVFTAGTIAVGATVVTGAVYCLSAANPGGIAPNADIAGGDYTTVLGIGLTGQNLQLIAGFPTSGMLHA